MKVTKGFKWRYIKSKRECYVEYKLDKKLRHPHKLEHTHTQELIIVESVQYVQNIIKIMNNNKINILLVWFAAGHPPYGYASSYDDRGRFDGDLMGISGTPVRSHRTTADIMIRYLYGSK